ncbi:MAG: GNAT family N-acetyltransferase [Planctomycetota bacterium]
MPFPSPLRFRAMAREDLAILTPWLRAADLQAPAPGACGDWWRRQRTDPYIVCRVAVDAADRVLGFLRLDLAPDGVAELTLLVAPDLRRGGLGGLLLERAMRDARDRRVKTVVASVVETNATARAFFAGAGFVEEPGPLPGYVQMATLAGAEPRSVEMAQ